MAANPNQNDAELRRILKELASGRLLVDEAYAQVKRLSASEAVAAAAAAQTRGGPRPPKKPTTSAVVIVGVILTLIGGLFGTIGFAFAWRSVHFESHGVRADGTVVRWVRNGGKKGTVKPVVQFLVDGKKFEVTGTIGSNSHVPHVGEKVQVLYDAADPSDAQIDTFLERWLFPVIFGGTGGGVGLIGLLLLLGRLLSRLARPVNIEDSRFSPE